MVEKQEAHNIHKPNNKCVTCLQGKLAPDVESFNSHPQPSQTSPVDLLPNSLGRFFNTRINQKLTDAM
jgi:hypothetical protein